MPLYTPGVTSIKKSGDVAITGDATLTGGTNVTLTEAGQDISVAAAGGSGAPGGSDTQVQYNNLSAFGGLARVTGDGNDISLVGSTSGSTKLIATANASGTLTLPAATDTLTGKATVDDLTNKRLYPLAAGDTTHAPLKHSTDTLLTTPQAGAYEYDGTVHYSTHAASERGVALSRQIIKLRSPYTLTSQTAAQNLFNSPANGQITLAAHVTYRFRCSFALASMSTSAGAFGFALGGTATILKQAWLAIAQKNGTSLATPTAATLIFATAATTISGSAASTAFGNAFIEGYIEVSSAGTIIPQVSLTVAAAAIVQAGAFFELEPVGADTVVSVGNWS